ncbi:MAG: hypothetical protein VX583_01605 [Bdellovibrionota bacterium]
MNAAKPWSEALEVSSLNYQNAVWELECFLEKHPNMRYAQEKIDKDLAKIGPNPLKRLMYFKENLLDMRKRLVQKTEELSDKVAQLNHKIK